MTLPPLRIALVTVEYPPDKGSYGLGTYTQALATALVARGHTVHVLARSPQGDSVEEQGQLTVHRLGPGRPELGVGAGLALALSGARALSREWGYRRKLARTLDALVRRERIHLVEAPDATAEALFYRPERHPGVPFVVKLHGPFAVAERYDKNVPEGVRRILRRLERRQLLKATHLSVPSGAVAPLFAREFAPLPPMAVVPNPPPYHLFPDPQPTARDPNLVLFAGRVTPMKGVDLFVEAIPTVLAERPETRFVIAGGDAVSAARFAESRAQLTARLPPAARGALHFTGRLPQTDLVAYYERAAVCAFPSRYEPYGYTCLEAMRFGNAVIGGRVGGMSDLLGDGAGLLIDADTSQLAAAMLRLLRDPDLRSSLGERAQERALGPFGTDSVLAQTEAFYHRAIVDRAPGRSSKLEPKPMPDER